MSNNFSDEYWENHYQGINEKVGNAWVSPYLLSIASGLSPGMALDAGCGEGGDAIWLSRQGWNVKAVDISHAVLQKAQTAAKANDASVDFEQVDLTFWTPLASSYDLVTSHYVHTTDNRRFITSLADAVKHRGTLLIVGHQPSVGHDKNHHAHGSQISADEVSAFLNLDEWKINVSEPRISERPTSSGQIVKLSDSVFIAQKVKG